MALQSMQKAANLDAFSEAAQEKVQSLEQELRNHEDDNGSVAEAVGTAPESEQGQDSVSASSGEVAEIQATSPVGEEESQDSEPGGAENRPRTNRLDVSMRRRNQKPHPAMPTTPLNR